MKNEKSRKNEELLSKEKGLYEPPKAVFMPVNLEERLLECDHAGGCWYGN